MHGTACTGHIIILIGILPDNDKEIMTNNKMTGNKLSISAFLSIVGGVIMIAGGTSTIFMFDWYQSTFGDSLDAYEILYASRHYPMVT